MKFKHLLLGLNVDWFTCQMNSYEVKKAVLDVDQGLNPFLFPCCPVNVLLETY